MPKRCQFCGVDGVLTAAYNSPREFTITGGESDVRAVEGDLRPWALRFCPMARGIPL